MATDGSNDVRQRLLLGRQRLLQFGRVGVDDAVLAPRQSHIQRVAHVHGLGLSGSVVAAVLGIAVVLFHDAEQFTQLAIKNNQGEKQQR